MQKPRDKGDYGITPTDEEKRRLSGEDQSGPTSPTSDKKQNGTDEPENTAQDSADASQLGNAAANRIQTPD